MDEIVSDNLNPPPVTPCIHHWIIQEHSDGQSIGFCQYLGICKKCDEHRVFKPSYSFPYPSKHKPKPKSGKRIASYPHPKNETSAP